MTLGSLGQQVQGHPGLHNETLSVRQLPAPENTMGLPLKQGLSVNAYNM